MALCGYDNWCAVAGFFDGDGCVEVTQKEDVVRIRLEFADNWWPRINQVRLFLVSKGIQPAKIWLSVGNAYEFCVTSNEGILAASKAMLAEGGCVYKKRAELQSAVDYIEDGLTGTQFIMRINESVVAGNRTDKLRSAMIPFTYSEGLRQRYIRSAARRAVLTPEQKKQIVIERTGQGLTYEKLASRYQVSITTIARIITVKGHHRTS